MGDGGPGLGSGLAGAVLGPAGISTLYGTPVAGLPVVAAEPGIAGVLARAHRVVGSGLAGAVGPDEIVIPGGTGEPEASVEVTDRTGAGDLVALIRYASRGGGIRIGLGVEPGAPWPGGVAPAPLDPWSGDLSEIVSRIDAATSIVILAGPGVVASGQVPGLHALAATLGAGVLNTWGAKGIFHWRSRHHWATVGLQQDDFKLAGLDGADLVLATGVDDREAPDAAWRHLPHVTVEPEELAPLAEIVASRPVRASIPPLRERLTAVTQAAWATEGSPLPPSRVTLHYGRQLTGGGLIAADAGDAGFWVARTFATTELGMVAVPPYRDPGWAVACVAVARLACPLRPALSVLATPPGEVDRRVLDFARSHGVSIGTEIWDAAGEHLGAAGHESRLARLIAPDGSVRTGTLATDPGQLEAFIAAAGAVRRWEPPEFD